MNIHRLIREGRRRLGMSEQQFAETIGVSRGAVQQWEQPGGTAPKRSNQPRVAKLLGISVAELMAGGSNVGRGLDVRAEVPLVSEVEAGNYTVIDNFKPKGRIETVPVSVPVKRHTYALRVHGDSMVSDSGDSFPEGSTGLRPPMRGHRRHHHSDPSRQNGGPEGPLFSRTPCTGSRIRDDRRPARDWLPRSAGNSRRREGVV